MKWKKKTTGFRWIEIFRRIVWMDMYGVHTMCSSRHFLRKYPNFKESFDVYHTDKSQKTTESHFLLKAGRLFGKAPPHIAVKPIFAFEQMNIPANRGVNSQRQLEANAILSAEIEVFCSSKTFGYWPPSTQ